MIRYCGVGSLNGGYSKQANKRTRHGEFKTRLAAKCSARATKRQGVILRLYHKIYSMKRRVKNGMEQGRGSRGK